jgi:hypothetical protein
MGFRWPSRLFHRNRHAFRPTAMKTKPQGVFGHIYVHHQGRQKSRKRYLAILCFARVWGVPNVHIGRRAYIVICVIGICRFGRCTRGGATNTFLL